MIRYSKKYWGLQTLLRWYGSAFPRALPFSLGSAILAGILEGCWQETLAEQWVHPYPYQSFAFIVGFMIVFRSNLGYGRFWEGRGHLVTMTSKLTDAVVQAVTFDTLTMPQEPTEEQIMEHERFKDNFVHLCSLLHAVALATLRDDFNMENIIVHDSDVAAPAANLMSFNQQAQRELADIEEGSEASFSQSRRRRTSPGSTSPKAAKSDASGSPIAAAHSKGDSAVIDAHRSLQDANDDVEQPPGPRMLNPTSRRSVELAFRASSGLRSWLDTFMLRTGAERAAQIYTHMKLPVIGGLTQAEGTALGAFATLGVDQAVPDFDVAVHGCTLNDGLYTPAPTERVHTVLAWIQQCLLQRMLDGGVKVAPPIQSRIHHVLSDTMLGYEQARKLVDTQFPFPWAQAITIVLTLFCITAPFLVSAYTTTVASAMIVTFIAVHTYIMLNEVARDIEDPFHYDPNELPLPQLQYKLNERFLAVARTTRPLAFTDITALHGPGNRPDMNSADMERYQSTHPATSQGFTPAVSCRVSDAVNNAESHLNRRTLGSKSAPGTAHPGDGTPSDASPHRGRPTDGRLTAVLMPFSATDATTLALAGKVKQKAVRWRSNAGGARRTSHDTNAATPHSGGNAADDEVRIHIDGLQANNRVHGNGSRSVTFQADSMQVDARLDTPFDVSEPQHAIEAGSGAAVDSGGGADWPSKELYEGMQRKTAPASSEH